jgi:hypothetical protein
MDETEIDAALEAIADRRNRPPWTWHDLALAVFAGRLVADEAIDVAVRNMMAVWNGAEARLPLATLWREVARAAVKAFHDHPHPDVRRSIDEYLRDAGSCDN